MDTRVGQKQARQQREAGRWYMDLLKAFGLNSLIWVTISLAFHDWRGNWVEARQFTRYLIMWYFMFRYRSTRALPGAKVQGYYIVWACLLALASEVLFFTLEERFS